MTEMALAIAGDDDAGLGGVPRILVPDKLSEQERDDYRNKARDLWERVTGVRASWRNRFLHHRIPLEWSHLFPRCHPNRPANLVAVSEATHDAINAEWRLFKSTLGDRVPSQREVLSEAIQIDQRYGGQMTFIDQFR